MFILIVKVCEKLSPIGSVLAFTSYIPASTEGKVIEIDDSLEEVGVT
jgi:hypothetical protein